MKSFFLVLFLAASFLKDYAQTCPVCIIDLTCDSVPAAPKLCPYELPEDTAGQYYSADMTFYIPQQFQDPQYGTVNLNQIDVLGVTGLPAGMTWTAYNYLGAQATSFFPPASPPASERGCAKICGTPPMPFDDSISVTVIAYVTVSGVSATQNSTFRVHLKIIPNPSGNSVFTMDNSQACDSLSVNFTPNLQSNGNPMITYDWNFGNGQTSTEEFPGETYLTPGDFSVSCTTRVYHYVVTSVSVNALNTNWCGDVEELICAFSNPDIFFQVNSNGGIATSDTVWNSKTPSWSNLNFPLEGNQFILYFFDADDGPPLGSVTDSLGYSTITVSGSGGTYNFNTPNPFSGTSGSITVVKQVKETYIDSDFVHVYSPPVLNPVSYTGDDSICSGDSVLLSLDGGYDYQWYNDTILLFGANDSSTFVKLSGNYWAIVTNGYGCSSNCTTQSIVVIPNPPKPNFIYLGNNMLKTFLSGYSLQWFFNGNPITGATTQTLLIGSSGYYQLSSFNGFCTTFSDSVFYNYTAPSINIAPTNVACYGGASGSATANVSGGSSPYTYQWSNGQTTKTATGLAAGTYTVTISDAIGATATQSIVITEPDDLIISVSETQNIQVPPNCDGTATAMASGGITPYNYSWSNGENGETATGLCGGNYSVTVTDANQCSQELPVTIIDNVGIESQITNLKSCISIYPNPNKGEFTIVFDAGNLTNIKILVSDVLGNEVFLESFKGISGSFSKSINLGSAEAGIYFLKLSEGGFTVNRKVVVQGTRN